MTPQIPQMPNMQMGNPMAYRMPQMGGGMNIGGSADYFSRGQAMLANASQSLGQMDKAKNETRTTTEEAPPMSAFDMLGAGVGYGLAGMQAYDLYQSWGKDKGNPYLQNQPSGMDPERRQIMDMFGTASPATGASPAGGSPVFAAGQYASPVSGAALPTGASAGAGMSGTSATAMGGRGAHEMLRGGLTSGSTTAGATGTSTAGLATTGGNAASMAGKMMPVAGAGLAAYGAFSQGQADRQAGGKNLGGAASSVAGGAMSGAMVGSAFGGVGAIPGAIIGGIGGGLLYLLG